MTEYKEIKYIDYMYLRDKSGYYKVLYGDTEITFFKNGEIHNEFGPADIYHGKEYYFCLNDKSYGNQNDFPTNEHWIRFVKLLAFA